MTDIYDQHKAAFSNVSAFVIARDGERVATIAFKYPRDGAGRLYAYIHWIGSPMVRGFASGFGYDKHAASVANAAKKIEGGARPDATFVHALAKDDGQSWSRNLENAGFTIWQAV